MSKPQPLPVGPFVLLDDNSSPDAPCYLFGDPETVIICRSRDEIEASLAAIEAARRRGLYAVGYLAYELGHFLEPKLHRLSETTDKIPLIWMGLFRAPKRMNAAETGQMIDMWGGDYCLGDLEPSLDCKAYLDGFERISRAIAAGDVYQINYTLNCNFAFSGDPAALYGRLRRRQRAAYGAIIDTGDFHILSLSPELFFESRNGYMRSRPMKGTAPRAASPKADAARREWLRKDEKSRAENLMIVDLIRNDLGRVAKVGSVEVVDLFRVETYPTLHQMTSEVTAQAAPDTGFRDILRALFPCGSVTGAPKIRAMELIHHLEPEPRGVYCGAIGMISPSGDMRFNVAIRTLMIDRHGNGKMGIGGGVVSDSDGREEYDECLLKAKFMSEIDKPFKLIETLRLENGVYYLLSHHMSRLGDSAACFGYPFNRTEIENRMKALAESLATGTYRIRLLLDEDGKIAFDSTSISLPADVDVMSFRFARLRIDRTSAFTYHKTTRRQHLDAERQNSDCDEVVFLNRDGEVTEGSVSNVFVERDGILLTPAVECGLLAGTLRRELLDRGRAREAILGPDDITGGKTVYLGNSVRGLVRAKPVESPKAGV